MTDPSDDFGPWLNHTQGQMPVGESVLVICEMNGDPDDLIGPMQAGDYDWNFPGDAVTRYRIRRDRAAERETRALADLIADVPAEVTA